MRLLAHGGTSYSERHRVGVWPDIPRHVLEATYGLPGETLSYGLGVLESHPPFLIVRQRQITGSGRSYAFSLLLDPGPVVWGDFGWNAADLLRALLDDETGRQLLIQPESFTVESLRQCLHRLRPSGPDSQSGVPADDDVSLDEERVANFLDCWVGAAFADETIVAAPGAFCFDARPDHARLARMLGRLPQPCFRAGSGWLVGGSSAHGQSLGARFVLDDGAAGAQDALSAQVSAGLQLIEAWDAIAADPEFEGTLSPLANVPRCDWPDVSGASAGTLRERLLLLARVLGTRQLTDNLSNTLKQLKGSDFLIMDIRRAAHRLALASTNDDATIDRGVGHEAHATAATTGDKLSPAQTEVVLRNFFEDRMEVSEAASRRLDPRKLVEMCLKYEPPGDAPSPLLRHYPELQVEVYARALETTPKYDDTRPLLLAAYDFVVRNFASESEAAEQQRLLLKALYQRTKADGANLHVWDAFPDNHPLWPGLANNLRDEAKRRAQLRSDGWELEYLCFGDDPGGERLPDLLPLKELEPAQSARLASQLVQCYLAELREQSDLALRAKAWLEALAASLLRPVVPVMDKVSIAHSHAVAGWRPLLALWDAYCNRASEVAMNESGLPAGLRAGVARDAARSRLWGELRQMLREKPPRDFFPALRRIVKMLGDVPSDVIEQLANYHSRTRNPHDFDRWIAGLLEMGERSRASTEVKHYIIQESMPLPDGWLFAGFDKRRLEEVADLLLFRGFSTEDERYRERCEEVLGNWENPERWRDIPDELDRARLGQAERKGREQLRASFDRVYREGAREKCALENFVRRYAGHESALEQLFACFSTATQDKAAGHLLNHDKGAFIKTARAIYEEARADASPLTPYRRAMLRCLRPLNDKKFSNHRAVRGLLHFFAEDSGPSLEEILARPTVTAEATVLGVEPEATTATMPETVAGDALDETDAAGHETSDDERPRVDVDKEGAADAAHDPRRPTLRDKPYEAEAKQGILKRAATGLRRLTDTLFSEPPPANSHGASVHGSHAPTGADTDDARPSQPAKDDAR